MFPTFPQLRDTLSQVIANKRQQGHVCDNLHEALRAVPDSYDALFGFAQRLSELPLREDWPYIEPDGWDEIQAQMDSDRPRGQWREIEIAEAQSRIETAFLSSVCGCVLGKPLEIMPDLAQLKSAFEKCGEWPISDYVPERVLDALGDRHVSWPTTTRGNIRFVEVDDDITYPVMGMLALEKGEINFTRADLCALWQQHLVMHGAWGPERSVIAKAALQSLTYKPANDEALFDQWTHVLNPGDELCGAQIRADAYGYACVGNPELAVELAWRDASFTHRKTGVYATMWTAAAIATAPVAARPLEIFEMANMFVPQRSRFYEIVSDSLQEVRASLDWMDGYNRIHDKYKEFSHCHVYQESGTLINTLHHATSIGDGLCKQVMQGNDTDSYGATAGSILGAYFGAGHLESRWLEPFNDDIHTGLAGFFERSLSSVAKRMADLPKLTLETRST
jgi:ADP-ribosylglycohydrolase